MAINFYSPEWHQIARWVEAEIDKVRRKNDALGLSSDDTAALRGEIRAFKRLLGLKEASARDAVAESE